MTREEAIEFYNKYKNYFEYTFFNIEYTSNSEGITISLYNNKRDRVLLASQKLNLVRNEWVNITTNNLNSLYVSNEIKSDIEIKVYNMKIDYISNGELDIVYKKSSRFDELYKIVNSRYKLEVNNLNERLNEVFLIFDDSYETSTTFSNINFVKLNTWLSKTIFNFTEINIENASRDIKLTIETKFKVYKKDPNQTTIQDKLNELEYYYTIRTEFIHRFLFFLNTQEYELITFSEKQEYSFPFYKLIISSSIKKNT